MGSTGNPVGGGDGSGIGTPVNIPGLPNFLVQAVDIGCPDTPTDLPRTHFKNYFKDAYCAFKDLGVPGWLSQFFAGLMVVPAGALMVIKDLVIIVARVVLPTFGAEILDALDDLRKGLDPSVGKLAVGVLNELLGTDVEAGDIPSSISYSDHLARADKLGGILHDVLLSEFATLTTVTPQTGQQAARRFSGLMINFGTMTGIMATLGGLVPEIHLDEVREIGEQVATNLGLGRLGRQVLRPVVDILMAEPYKWFINEQYRPTQLTIGDAVNPFTNTIVDPALIHESLARQGYSDDKISAIIELHQKKLAESEFFYLYSQGLKTEDDFLAYLKKVGYSDNDALDRKEVEFLKAETSLQDELVSTAMDAYKFGNIGEDELQGIVKTARPLPNLQALTMLVANYKKKVPHRSLTIAQLTSMLETDIITIDEFDSYIINLGFSVADTQNLRILTLMNASKKAAADAAKAAKAAAKSGTTTTTTTGTAGTTTPAA